MMVYERKCVVIGVQLLFLLSALCIGDTNIIILCITSETRFLRCLTFYCIILQFHEDYASCSVWKADVYIYLILLAQGFVQ